MEILDKIIEGIKEIREVKNLTQQEMADQTGISKSFIGNVESGKQSPSYDFIVKLCTTYGISLDWLFFRSGKMYRIDNDFLNQVEEQYIQLVKNIMKLNLIYQIKLVKAINAAMDLIPDSEKDNPELTVHN